jgi:hypothetical protein
MAQLRPRFLVFAQIWAFIHPVSPGHPRPSGARSGTPDERNVRETARKFPARRVAQLIGERGRSSSSSHRLRSIVIFRAHHLPRCKSLPPMDVQPRGEAS